MKIPIFTRKCSRFSYEPMATDRPLVETAMVLIGRGGAVFAAVAVMISSYGWIAGSTLNAPRIAYAFSAHGDFPRFLRRLHSRDQTPVLAIFIYSALVWALALTGTFLWVAAKLESLGLRSQLSPGYGFP